MVKNIKSTHSDLASMYWRRFRVVCRRRQNMQMSLSIAGHKAALIFLDVTNEAIRVTMRRVN